MTIPAIGGRIKRFLGKIPTDALIVLVVLLGSILSFGLGIMAGKDMASREGNGLWIEQRPLEAAVLEAPEGLIKAEAAEPIPEGGQYVASKNGEAYYLPWCGGVSRINDENKVWFASKEEAEAKGYRPAKTCKGI